MADHDHEPEHHHEHDQPTAEQDFVIAEQAFQQGDLEHAAFHVSAALAVNPLQPEWRALLDRIIGAAPHPEQLIPIKDGAYFGHVAGHAYILASTDQLDTAFDLLGQVMRVCPERGYHVWATEWLQRCRGKEVDLNAFLGVLSDLIQPTIGRLRLRPAERFTLAGAVAMVRELLCTQSGRESHLFQALASGVLRRAGAADEAVALARRSLELEPTTTGAISLGLAARLKGDHPTAEQAFLDAQSSDDDPVYEMELARTLWEAGELQRALVRIEAYRDALEHEDPECEMTRDYLRFRLHGDEDGAWIRDSIGDHGGPDDIRLLLYPCVGYLPESSDATVNVLRQIYDEVGHVTDGELEVSVSHLEAPSVRLALVLMTMGSTDLSKASYSCETIPSPDPRKPRRPVQVELWRYVGPDGAVPEQVVSPPEPSIFERIAAIAQNEFYLPRWWREAGELARELGESTVPSLLGTMVHPSMPPDEMQGFVWIQRLQVASALVLGQIDSGWTDSRRRELLLSLVNGAMDWTTDAGIIALTEVALEEPAAVPEVAQLFLTLLDEIPEEGHTWYGEVLAQSFLRLPGRPPHEREVFEELLESLEPEEEEEEEEPAN